MESVNETSDLKTGSRFCDDAHFDDLFVSQKSEQSTFKRQRGRPSKVILEKGVEGNSTRNSG